MKDKKYYRLIGYIDGSGRIRGYIIKCYTKEEYERYSKTYMLVPMEGKKIDEKSEGTEESGNQDTYKRGNEVAVRGDGRETDDNYV